MVRKGHTRNARRRKNRKTLRRRPIIKQKGGRIFNINEVVKVKYNPPGYLAEILEVIGARTDPRSGLSTVWYRIHIPKQGFIREASEDELEEIKPIPAEHNWKFNVGNDIIELTSSGNKKRVFERKFNTNLKTELYKIGNENSISNDFRRFVKGNNLKKISNFATETTYTLNYGDDIDSDPYLVKKGEIPIPKKTPILVLYKYILENSETFGNIDSIYFWVNSYESVYFFNKRTRIIEDGASSVRGFRLHLSSEPYGILLYGGLREDTIPPYEENLLIPLDDINNIILCYKPIGIKNWDFNTNQAIVNGANINTTAQQPNLNTLKTSLVTAKNRNLAQKAAEKAAREAAEKAAREAAEKADREAKEAERKRLLEELGSEKAVEDYYKFFWLNERGKEKDPTYRESTPLKTEMIPAIVTVMQSNNPDALKQRVFQQHKGNCWYDAILTILLEADELKRAVAPILEATLRYCNEKYHNLTAAYYPTMIDDITEQLKTYVYTADPATDINQIKFIAIAFQRYLVKNYQIAKYILAGLSGSSTSTQYYIGDLVTATIPTEIINSAGGSSGTKMYYGIIVERKHPKYKIYDISTTNTIIPVDFLNLKSFTPEQESEFDAITQRNVGKQKNDAITQKLGELGISYIPKANQIAINTIAKRGRRASMGQENFNIILKNLNPTCIKTGVKKYGGHISDAKPLLDKYLNNVTSRKFILEEIKKDGPIKPFTGGIVGYYCAAYTEGESGHAISILKIQGIWHLYDDNTGILPLEIQEPFNTAEVIGFTMSMETDKQKYTFTINTVPEPTIVDQLFGSSGLSLNKTIYIYKFEQIA